MTRPRTRLLVGKKFGTLTITHEEKSIGYVRYVGGSCDCGEKFVKRVDVFRSKWFPRCPICMKRHGMKNTKEWSIWQGMKRRCNDKKNNAFHDYGGRGISVCERWIKFENFYEDMGPIPSSKHTIDRIDVNGNYEPSNCRWATYQQQARNKRNKNKFGVPGVVIENGKWRVRIRAGKLLHLGSFDNLLDAIAARKSAENKYWKGDNT